MEYEKNIMIKAESNPEWSAQEWLDNYIESRKKNAEK